MKVFLHKGAWCEFKIALALHLKESAKHWDSYLSRKIHMILQEEEMKQKRSELNMTPKSHRGAPDTPTWSHYPPSQMVGGLPAWLWEMKASKQENVYFLAGLPLQYWSFGKRVRELEKDCEIDELGEIREKHGLKVISPEMINSLGNRTGVNGVIGFEWMTKEHIQKFGLSGDLPTFSEWKKQGMKCRKIGGWRRGSFSGRNYRTDDEIKRHWDYIGYLMEKEQELIDGSSSCT